jgi:hypothetical protein
VDGIRTSYYSQLLQLGIFPAITSSARAYQ